MALCLAGCGYDEKRRAEIDDCCECLATTPKYDWQDPPQDYCWDGATYQTRKDQCVRALDNDQEPYIDSTCSGQKCGGSCPMLND